MNQVFIDDKRIISIKPEHVANIISGKKTAEIRRGRVKKLRKGDWLFIYETAPTCALTAFAVVQEIITDWPQQLWDRLKREGHDPCITREQFAKYTGENKTYNHDPDLYATAIILDGGQKAKYSFSLAELKENGITPPQKYATLTPKQNLAIVSMMAKHDKEQSNE